MRILVLGAGGIGGYYGGRLHQAGGDVTFLVRPARAAKLRASGLHVHSAFGDLEIAPRVVTNDELGGTAARFDVILLSCKAYDLESAIAAIAPAVGAETVIVPLLNGIRHIDSLVARFGEARVLGGVALISVLLGPEGEIRHVNKMHRLVVGARPGQGSKWLAPINALFAGAGFDFVASPDVEQAMWDKVVFLTTLAGATCTLRASIGTIMKTSGGEGFITGLFAECAAIAAACGHAVSETQLGAYRTQLTDRSSPLVASMLRDVEKGGPTEAEHIVGDLYARAERAGVATPLLQIAYSHLQAYELRRSEG